MTKLRKSDLVRIKPRPGDLAMFAEILGLDHPATIGIVMDIYEQPQINKVFVQVLIGETINWYPETGCELVQRGSYVVE